MKRKNYFKKAVSMIACMAFAMQSMTVAAFADDAVSGYESSDQDTGSEVCTEHNYIESVLTEAICTEDGLKQYVCSVCGASYQEAIPAAGHQWDEGVVTVEPTTEEAGVKTFTCAVCGETKTEEVEKLLAEESPFTYEVLSDGICKVTGYTGTETEVVIPETIDGYTVTDIDSTAFYGNTSLTSISIPSGVTTIGMYTFSNCTGLVHVEFHEGLERVNWGAFYNCTSLTDVVFPNGTLGIATNAFESCTGLISVTIPSSVTNIGFDAFPDTCYIICDKDSYAYSFASEYNFTTYRTTPCAEEEHIWGDSVCTKEASHTRDGVLTYECTICGALYEEAITAEGHTWNADDICTICGLSKERAQLEADFTYEMIDDTHCRILKYNGDEETLDIPDTIDGYQVQTIGDGENSVFSGCFGLKEVTVPEGVTEIAGYSFSSSTGIETVILPGSVTSIGWYAFYQCSGMKQINIPEGITTINHWVFYGCSSLENVIIPDSVTRILYSPFCGCTSLTSITIPENVETIEYGAFSGCSNLSNVSVLSTETVFNDDWGSIFASCSSDLVIKCWENSTAQTYAENNSITCEFFDCCSEHTYGEDDPVIAREATCTVAGIKKSTCTVCGFVKRESIPATGHQWANNVCSVCNTSMYQYSVIDDGTCIITGRYGEEENLVIPDEIDGYTVTGIGSYALQYLACTSVVIPASVTSIDVGTFCDCNNLSSVTIKGKDTSIGEIAFKDCSSDLVITCWEDSPAQQYAVDNDISYEFLQECEEHTYGEPVAVTEPTCTEEGLQKYTCVNCGYEKTEKVPATGHLWEGNSCSVCNSSIYEYTASDDGTCEITGYLGDETTLNIPDVIDDHEVTKIGDSAFKSSDITSVVIPDSVTEIGAFAFGYCSNLTEVEFSSNLESIGDSAFRECIGLTALVFPTSLTDIGNYAFFGCSSLTSVSTASDTKLLTFFSELFITNVEAAEFTRIGEYAFGNCVNLVDVQLPDDIEVIDTGAFSGCSSLTEVTIPESVTEIGDSAFADCSNLEEVIIPEGVTSIGDSAFSGCSSLSYVTIPDSVETIGENSFSDCGSVKIICSDDSYAKEYASDNNISSGKAKTCEIHTPGDITIVKEAAFNETGLRTYTCTVCGQEVEEVIPALNYRLSGYQLVLNGKYNLRYYVELTDELSGRDDLIMRFTVGDTVYESACAETAGNNQIFVCELEAAQISESITAELIYDGESHEIGTYSVKEYLNTLIQNPDRRAVCSAAKVLARTLLSYSKLISKWKSNGMKTILNRYMKRDVIAKLDSKFTISVDAGNNTSYTVYSPVICIR